MAKATKALLIPDDIVMNKIYLIRGQKVMLDRDLAELYGVTTGNLNLAVKRNLKRFPPDFMFRLTKREWERSRWPPQTPLRLHRTRRGYGGQRSQ